MMKSGQYNCIKQTASYEFKVLSPDRVSNIPFNMHVFMLSWDPTLGFMQYQEHFKLLIYILRVEHELGRNADCRRYFLMSSKLKK